MKIEPLYTEQDFLKLTLPQLHQIWFNEALTDGQIAKLYRTTKNVVRARRKELHLNVINAAFLSLTGGDKYADDRALEKRKQKQQKKLEKQIEKEKRLMKGKNKA